VGSISPTYPCPDQELIASKEYKTKMAEIAEKVPFVEKAFRLVSASMFSGPG
jgi:hypothetical protein